MERISIQSPIAGKSIALTEVPDPVFSQKMVGDGIAFNPANNTVVSPIAGTVTLIHKAKHAITIEKADGTQILIHIGIDTVQLKGSAFESHIQQGDAVQINTPLITFDLEAIVKTGLSPLVIMIVTKPNYIISACDNIQNETGEFQFSVKSDEQIALPKSDKNSAVQKAYESLPIVLRMPNGMHARPASILVSEAKRFESFIEIIKETEVASLKSIISIMSLNIQLNDEIFISAVGNDCKDAVHTLSRKLIELEEEELNSSQNLQKIKVQKNPPLDNNALAGIRGSDGIAIGKVFQLKKEIYDFSKFAKNSSHELENFNNSLQKSITELTNLVNTLKETNNDQANIFNAHLEIIRDEELIEQVKKMISSGHSAAYSWDQNIEGHAKKLESLDNEYMAARGNDFRDIGHRVLIKILGIKPKSEELQTDEIILIAEDLTPSEIIKFQNKKVVGFCTTKGGATSHIAIIAKSMGLPAILAIDKKALKINNGEKVILNATEECLILSPNSTQIADAKLKINNRQLKLDFAQKNAHLPCETLDGVKLQVMANIGNSDDLKLALSKGAQGVGLLRSEFLYLDSKEEPSEDYQSQKFQAIADQLSNKPFVIRTLDIGGDKPLTYFPLDHEDNPFLGVRGIRLCFQFEEAFRRHIRSILKIKNSDRIHLMFPMISQIDEFVKAKNIVMDEASKLNLSLPKIGMMIEVPSAALMAEHFAPLVDFFSIGTNDLTQYTLAMDRGHEKLAKQIDALAPSVLHLIHTTVKAAHKYGKWVGICGGVAGEIQALPAILSLGIDEISLSPSNIPLVKETIRSLNSKECQSHLESILSQNSAKSVRNYIKQHWPNICS